MRRKERQISGLEAYQLLEKGEYGIVSMVSKENEPYGVPVNYCLIGDTIYFHCALEGEKIDCINNNSRVSFCVVGRQEILPAEFSTNYESCIIAGNIVEVYEADKHEALEALIVKYSPDYYTEGMEYIEKLHKRTRVFGITIEMITGKKRQ